MPIPYVHDGVYCCRNDVRPNKRITDSAKVGTLLQIIERNQNNVVNKVTKKYGHDVESIRWFTHLSNKKAHFDIDKNIATNETC